ncbi:MAG: hypothetical protein ACI9TH_004427 [Kiritimatiellia bacterium]|jgi:hypothetical protein
MKFKSILSTATGCIALSLLGTSCDWSGGGDSNFNTSGGSVAINISGSYRGILGDGRAVSNTSGGSISSLVLQQSGNTLEVSDSNGQRYRGTVGSPLALASPDDAGFLSVGAQLANFQVSWSGKDGVAAKDISFSGVISVVTVDDIQGDTTIQTVDSNVANSSGTDNSSNANVVNTQGSDNSSSNTSGSSVNGSTQTDITTSTDSTQVVNDPAGFPTITEGENITVTRSTTDARNAANSQTTALINQNNAVTTTDRNITDSNLLTSNNNTARTITSTFAVTGNNAQYRLRGSWVENGGVVASVDAVAEAAGGTVQTVTTAAP